MERWSGPNRRLAGGKQMGGHRPGRTVVVVVVAVVAVVVVVVVVVVVAVVVVAVVIVVVVTAIISAVAAVVMAHSRLPGLDGCSPLRRLVGGRCSQQTCEQ